MHRTLALLQTASLACSAESDNGTDPAPAPAEPPGEIPIYGYKVIAAYPHDPGAFTQGLLYRDGFLYESTGLNGQSSLRKVALATGEVLQIHALEAHFFAEGLAHFANRLIQLTWKSQQAFAYDIDSFEPLTRFTYATAGWGLACDGEQLILSDGTATLYFRNPFTFEEISRVEVSAQGRPIRNLNELEWVEGEIFANIWETDTIARIDPASGQVKGWIDASGLLSTADRQSRRVDVLNDIAYDAKGKRLFLTGKWWPKLYHIELVNP